MEGWFKDVIQIGGTVGALWAALSARKSAKISSKQLDNQIEEKKQVDRPRLVPLNHRVSTEIDSIFSDWETDEIMTKFRFKQRYKMSRFTVPIINTGNTHAFDVRYSFKLRGGIDSFRDYDGVNVRLLLADPELRQLGREHFNFIAYEFPIENPNAYEKQEVEVIPYIQYIPLIQNDKSGEMHLPKFFVILSNVYLDEYWKTNPNINNPEVIVTLRYKDQLHVEHTDRYLMTLSTKQVRTSGPEVNTWVDFEYIKPPKNDKKAHP
ncbi:hypothetical protein [Exiguobacterium sp. s127]|uniref:hypothetical protein n=1 Tax=Exiguobacterium sp. s127 TaxID=2751210 RepID=UPI001BEBE041|nr:hypothetical protein [Exiguobacterium sp. s127]